MIVLFALLSQAMVPGPLPPQDWTTLRPLPYSRDTEDGGDLADFVRAEVRSGRCNAALQGSSGWSLRVDVAVLVTSGHLRRVVPRAIQCPAVEQYAAGLVSSMARGNIAATTIGADGWYKTSLTFTWAQ